MYSWYRNAAVYYVYLYDVRSDIEHMENDLRISSWFTRGWTLQELIAPRRLEFFAGSWEHIGTRESLADTLHNITRITRPLLVGASSLEEYSIAQRMSWAAGRNTTLPEDRAYSLMGICGVNLPMLYGEGPRAFMRLQEEIIKRSADHSIFAWRLGPADEGAYHGLLAQSPDQFARCEQVIELPPIDMLSAYMQTNIGTQIPLTSRIYTANIYHVALNCKDENDERIGIFLGFPPEQQPTGPVGRRLYTGLDRTGWSTDKWRHHQLIHDFVVPQRPFLNQSPSDPVYGFKISYFYLTYAPTGYAYSLGKGIDVLARPDSWDPDNSILTLPPGTNGVAMAFVVRTANATEVIGKLGLDKSFRPWIWILEHDEVPKPVSAAESDTVTTGNVQDLAWPYDRGINRPAESILEEGFDFNKNRAFLSRRYVGHPLDGVLHLNDNDGDGKLIIMIHRKKIMEQLIWNVEVNIIRRG